MADVDQWKRDLAGAGWTSESATAWRAPDGSLWRGPYGAWRELKRRNTEYSNADCEHGESCVCDDCVD